MNMWHFHTKTFQLKAAKVHKRCIHYQMHYGSLSEELKMPTGNWGTFNY